MHSSANYLVTTPSVKDFIRQILTLAFTLRLAQGLDLIGRAANTPGSLFQRIIKIMVLYLNLLRTFFLAKITYPQINIILKHQLENDLSWGRTDCQSISGSNVFFEIVYLVSKVKWRGMLAPSWVVDQGRAQENNVFTDSVLSVYSFRWMTAKITTELIHISVVVSKLLMFNM